MFAGNFAPAGWMFCDGQLLAISSNETLFQLIGTTYGGDGQNTFALPDLRSRVPIHQGNGFILAETGGAEEITLTTQQIPSHNHSILCNSVSSSSPTPDNGFWGFAGATAYLSGFAANATMNPATIGLAGGSQPHENMLPFVGISYIISLFGVFPSPT